MTALSKFSIINLHFLQALITQVTLVWELLEPPWFYPKIPKVPKNNLIFDLIWLGHALFAKFLLGIKLQLLKLLWVSLSSILVHINLTDFFHRNIPILFSYVLLFYSVVTLTVMNGHPDSKKLAWSLRARPCTLNLAVTMMMVNILLGRYIHIYLQNVPDL